jgi:Flp pilus assembly protein TadD
MAARAIVDQPLKTRMVQLADRTILDYRHDAPVVTEAQWRQAWACLTLAADVAPDDRAVDAKRHVVQGHLKRLSARVPAEFQDAIRDFREAALLDPTVPDPYLGLARVHADNVRDVDALADDIRKAVALGYQSSRRERAELGGAYKTRADDR